MSLAPKKVRAGHYTVHGFDIIKGDGGWYVSSNHYEFACHRETLKAATNAIDNFRATTTRTVKNAMTGELVEERLDTPHCCSVASEAYWCM